MVTRHTGLLRWTIRLPRAWQLHLVWGLSGHDVAQPLTSLRLHVGGVIELGAVLLELRDLTAQLLTLGNGVRELLTLAEVGA